VLPRSLVVPRPSLRRHGSGQFGLHEILQPGQLNYIPRLNKLRSSGVKETSECFYSTWCPGQIKEHEFTV
jgi:hypothetical protein